MDELVESVRRAIAADTHAEFERRAERQATALTADIREGRLDNRDFAVGLELEAYAVDGEGRLCAAPESAFEIEGCEPELGVHNVEIHTTPDVLDDAGFERQARQLEDRVEAVRRTLGAADRRLILDGMWTTPPAEGTAAYLAAGEERRDVLVAENMRRNPRYAAIDNATRRHADEGIVLDVPGVERRFPSILVESLATSMQPHLQIPETGELPRYFNAAVRTLGPVLALATNSPFLPADLYEDPSPALVEETPHELRIYVFEQSINVGDRRKVRVPRDIKGPEDVAERLLADETVAPFVDGADGADEADGAEDAEKTDYRTLYPELEHKRGTYWRWLRTVVGGDVPAGTGEAGGNDTASVRIEYRPLPTQPTVRDTLGMQALTVGLLRGLVDADHPLPSLPWEAAERSFYAAAEDGLDATLAWVTADGERTDDPEAVYDEVFRFARRGLRTAGLDGEAVEEALAPIEARWKARTTPSAWKKARVRDALDDGASFAEALAEMQRTYVRRAEERESFAEWP